MMKKGFTLIELVMALAVIVILAIIFVGALNPAVLINKAKDVQKKKDLRRIGLAFEDYYGDKNCYPSQAKVDELMLLESCDSWEVFNPWLNKWPCDPNGKVYQIAIGGDPDCPKWYKILTNLENLKDKDIPIIWRPFMSVGNTQVNYGVSSSNVLITDYNEVYDTYCQSLGSCYYYPEPDKCNKQDGGCVGDNCYMGECSTRCKVVCCGDGCN